MKKPKAADLISQASSASGTKLPPPDALVELKKILDHNDTAPRPLRVSAERVLELLQSYNYSCRREKLNAVCKAAFGRHSFGAP
jgi:hypothetical protein